MPEMHWDKSRPMPQWMLSPRHWRYTRLAWLAQPSWVDRGSIRTVYVRARRRGLTVDHVVPLKGVNGRGEHVVCGLHVPWNLELCTPARNMAKGNRWWPGMWHEQVDWVGHEEEPVQLNLRLAPPPPPQREYNV